MGTSVFGVHSNTAACASATTSLASTLLPWRLFSVSLSRVLSTFGARQKCHSPSFLEGSKSQQANREIQATIVVINGVNWLSHLKRLSTLNRTCPPHAPLVIKKVFVEATPTVPEHTGVLFCTEEPLIGLPSGVTHQQYPVQVWHCTCLIKQRAGISFLTLSPTTAITNHISEEVPALKHHKEILQSKEVTKKSIVWWTHLFFF